MLIVCPSCATSYMIDPASVGSAGRTVRCARCKTPACAGGTNKPPDVAAFVHGVIAEAEAENAGPSAAGPRSKPDAAAADNAPAADDDFGAESPETISESSHASGNSEAAAAADEPATHSTDLV